MIGASQARRLFARHSPRRWLSPSPWPQRLRSTKANPKTKSQPDAEDAGPLYPERLLVFDAGVGRTFLVASVRVTTLVACLGSIYTSVLPEALKARDLKDALHVAQGTYAKDAVPSIGLVRPSCHSLGPPSDHYAYTYPSVRGHRDADAAAVRAVIGGRVAAVRVEACARHSAAYPDDQAVGHVAQ
jgi:hypothetical protein